MDHKGELLDNPTGASLQVMTASPDGTCLVWDLRNDPKETPEVASSYASLHLTWKPYFKVGSSSVHPQCGVGSFITVPCYKVYLSSSRSNGFLATKIAMCQRSSLPQALRTGTLDKWMPCSLCMALQFLSANPRLWLSIKDRKRCSLVPR